MILPFSTKFNGKPTMFTNKIVKCMWQNYPKLMKELALSRKLPDHYVFEDLTIMQVEKLNPKLHTIRDDKNDRWKPGTMIDFFINCRQKDMFRFAPKLPVVSVQDIVIKRWGTKPKVYINDSFFPLPDKEVLNLAQNDGFDTVKDFFEYFNKDFTGKIIHWTDFKY